MKITNEFTVHTPIDRAWALLTDLESIAPCLPGAQLTGVDGDVYQGKVKVKVGPVISEFAGTAQFAEKDDAGYRAVIDAKGRDARSAGNASALVIAQLRPDGDETRVSVDTDLKISGKLAQFGSGMIKEVSGKLLAQFVTNLEAKLAAEDAPAAAPVPDTAPVPSTAPTPEAVPEPAEAAAEAAATAPAAAPAPAAAAAAAAAAATAMAPGAAPIPEAVPEPVEAAASASAAAPGQPPSTVSATAAQPPPAQPAPVAPPAQAAAPAIRAFVPPAEEPEALDLLSIAGRSIYKRAIPVAAGLVVIGAVIAWFVVRRG